MKALILNSGIGKRMGGLTLKKPKCMAEIGAGHTIISWQLRLLQEAGIPEVVMTTGPFAGILKEYVCSLQTGLMIRCIENPDYKTTNYIYSIYCAREHLDSDILLLHGDLVLEPSVIHDLVTGKTSAVTVDSLLPCLKKTSKRMCTAAG